MPPPYKELSAVEAAAVAAAGKSPRYATLERLQAFYESKAYEGRVKWNATSDVPLQEREPCVIFPSARCAIESHANFALGEGKFPQVLSLTNEDDTGNDGLSKADSQKLDAFNQRFAQTARLESAVRQLLRMAMSSKSACAVLGFRKGLPNVEPLWAKCCTPTFNPNDPDEVLQLEVSYRYVEQKFDNQTGTWKPAVFVYRRVIDAKADTTFVPVRVDDKTSFPVPGVVDAARTVVHGFGFCPVVWWRCMATPDSGIDGHAIHEQVLAMVEALDTSLSQRQRAALYAGDPQWFMSGVDPENPVGVQGRRPRIEATPDNPTGDPGKAGQWGAAIFGVGSGGREKVTKKGPGVVWASESPDAKASLIALPPGALDAIDANAQDLLSKLAEAMNWVRVDAASLRGTADISAKAMIIMYAKQLAFVAQLRQDAGDKLILPALSLFYRMLLKVPDRVFVPGLKNVLGIIAKMQINVTPGVTLWVAPKLKLKWPAYFDPSDADETTRVTAAQGAFDGGLITLATAVEHIKEIFAIANVEQYVTTLTAEKAKRQADAMAAAAAAAPAAPTPAIAAGKPGAKPVAVPAKPAPGAPKLAAATGTR